MNVRKKLMAGGLALSVISAALPMTGCNSIKELDNSRECTVETVGKTDLSYLLNISKNNLITDSKITTDNHYDCIVLGGGIAGVSTAKELKNSGKEVLILEAKDYIGGRMHSIHDFTMTDDGSEVKKGDPI